MVYRLKPAHFEHCISEIIAVRTSETLVSFGAVSETAVVFKLNLFRMYLLYPFFVKEA
jgi:hypothetical protein